MTMQTTIVYAHPYEDSLNHAILERLVATLEAKGHSVTVLDLYADQFNPVLSAADLAVYGEGKTTDPQVERYVQILDQTEQIIFIYPIWWYDMPAIMRGFLDKVLLPKSAFETENQRLLASRQVRKTYIFTTSAASTEDLEQVFGDPVRGTTMAGTFKDVGFLNPIWYNLGGIGHISQEEIDVYLATLSSRV